MAIRTFTVEEMLAKYDELKEANKAKERAPRTNREKEELAGSIKNILDHELDGAAFTSTGILSIAPADIGELLYDDWGELTGKKAATKAYRVRSIKDIITEYCKEKGYEAKAVGGRGQRTVITISKDAPKTDQSKNEPKTEDQPKAAAKPKTPKAK